jgi:hypothetical protein
MSSQLIFPAYCIDNEDPLRLGRIRVKFLSENNPDLESGNYIEWSQTDPFLVLPLMPFFIQVSPKKDDYVHIIYSNPEYKNSTNRFYISGVYSSPTTADQEPNYQDAQTNLQLGTQNKKYQNIVVNGSERETNKGVYGHPDDVILYGRGTSDIVIKKDTLLLRSGKNLPHTPTSIPNRYDKRSFLQLSKFDSTTEIGKKVKKYVVSQTDKFVKTLVEYIIYNPDNTQNNFIGDISIYSLDEKSSTRSSNVYEDTDLLSVRTMKCKIDIKNKTTDPDFNVSLEQFSKIVNDVLVGIANNTLVDVLKKHTNNTSSTCDPREITNSFPFFYRPNNSIINISSSAVSTISTTNTLTLFVKIKNPIDNTNKRTALVFDTKEIGIPTTLREIYTSDRQVTNQRKTVTINGSDKIFLLSHESQIPGKEKIDMSNTLYGLTEDFLSEKIEPNTSSMVRGEEMLELIRLIVEFLVSHVHPFPGLPAVPITTTGLDSGTILKELLNATNKILNKNIRIN